jgi:hypothetical protein
VLHARYERNPERFVRGRPVVKLPTRFVAINPITLKENGDTATDRVNCPTITAVGYGGGK